MKNKTQHNEGKIVRKVTNESSSVSFVDKNSSITKNKFTFITDEALREQVQAVLDKAKNALADNEESFYKNSVDPFSALFDSLWQNIPLVEWIVQEKLRQKQKTLQNALGNFHQNILGSMKGWTNMGIGKVFDIKNDEKKIIAEIKNKHNTTKGNHKTAIYDDLQAQLDKKEYRGYTAYYVEIIPKNKEIYDEPFVPSDNKTKTRRPKNEAIRVIDGKSFYSLVTGDPEALKKVYKILPAFITETLGKSTPKLSEDEAFAALFEKIY